MAYRKNISAALATALFSFTGLLYAVPIIGPDAYPADGKIDIPQSCYVLFRALRGTGGKYCSATIISRTQALTAAHCGSPEYSNPELYCGVAAKKYTGTLTVNSGYDSNGEGWAKWAKDYAFITLEEGQEFSAAPLPFAKSSQWKKFSNYGSNQCLVAGWGDNNYNTYAKLYMAPVYEIAFAETNSAVVTIGWTGKNANSGAHGDSGGTLMCEDEGAWYLVGVIVGGKDFKGAAVSTIDWHY